MCIWSWFDHIVLTPLLTPYCGTMFLARKVEVSFSMTCEQFCLKGKWGKKKKYSRECETKKIKKGQLFKFWLFEMFSSQLNCGYTFSLPKLCLLVKIKVWYLFWSAQYLICPRKWDFDMNTDFFFFFRTLAQIPGHARHFPQIRLTKGFLEPRCQIYSGRSIQIGPNENYGSW